MKHYLLTWYGITDLRASLELDVTDGPIFGALKTGNFTDVIILAYTNPDKGGNDADDDLIDEWKAWRALPPEQRPVIPYSKAQQFTDVFSNTIAGHTLYTEWLNEKLSAANISLNIHIVPKDLKHLNDADGIYNAAASALQLALHDTCEKTITSFISPGTPVMAYTWALIARANPQLNIGVISSSVPSLPPEEIELPKELLMPMPAIPQSAKPSAFDVIIHLLGRERMPIYFGIYQFKAKEHVFVTTQEYADAAAILSRLLPQGCRSKTIFIKDPFKPADTRIAIGEQAACYKNVDKIAVNLTGGTKLMFAGALSACWQHGLEPFYFEINNHNIIFIRDGSTVPFAGVKTIKDFFAVNGFDVITQGRWGDKRNDRLNITQKLWESRKIIQELYKNKDFQKYNPPWGVKPNPPFDWRWGKSYATFNTNLTATLVLDGEEISVPNCDDFGQYLGGGWFEEYVFNLLHKLEKEELIYDLRIGLEVNYAEPFRNFKTPPTGEFDCAFTDGQRLWLVECKAGIVKQEHIQKLENNLKTYGGIAAKGILVSAFPITGIHKKRLSFTTSIYTIQSENLEEDLFLEKMSKILKSP